MSEYILELQESIDFHLSDLEDIFIRYVTCRHIEEKLILLVKILILLRPFLTDLGDGLLLKG